MRSKTNVLLSALLVLVLVACGQGQGEGTAEPQAAPPPPPPAPESASLELLEPHANLLPNGMGAVYVSIHNPSGQDERLVSAESASAEAVEIHESLEENGVMRMVAHPDGVAIPAGATVDFAPGGKHIMLINTRVEEGATSVALTLHFEHAGALEVEASVKGDAEMDHGKMDHGEMGHGEMEHGETEH